MFDKHRYNKNLEFGLKKIKEAGCYYKCSATYLALVEKPK